MGPLYTCQKDGSSLQHGLYSYNWLPQTNASGRPLFAMRYCSTIDEKDILFTKHVSDLRHPLFQYEPAAKMLKPSNSFFHAVNPLDGKPHSCSIDYCSTHLHSKPHKTSRGVPAKRSHSQPGSVSAASGLVSGAANT